jgi:hypothetical protein
MLPVPAPDVMHPLVMLHAYLAPVPPLANNAVLPDELAQTEDAAVMLATGYADMVTNLLPDDALQPAALVTVTESVTEPDAPAA